jgi:hypothetical protein
MLNPAASVIAAVILLPITPHARPHNAIVLMAATGLEAEMVVLGTVDNGLAPITPNAPPSLGQNQLIREARMGQLEHSSMQFCDRGQP